MHYQLKTPNSQYLSCNSTLKTNTTWTLLFADSSGCLARGAPSEYQVNNHFSSSPLLPFHDENMFGPLKAP